MRSNYVLFFCLLITLTRGQQWGWAINEKVAHMAVDHYGNILLLQDSTLKKLSSQGNTLWQKQFSGDLSLTGMVADGDGTFYVIGNFRKFSYDGQQFETSGPTNTFLACLDPGGTLVWNKIYGGGGACLANDLSLGTNNRLHLCGCLYAGASFESRQYDSTGFFAASTDLSGNLQTIRKYTGASGWEIESDSIGNIYVLGGGGDGDSIRFENGLKQVGYFPGFHFMAKYTPAGVLQWAKNFGDNYYAPHRTLAVERNGYFYLTKWERYDGFDLSRYDPNGVGVWGRNFSDVYGDCSSLLIDKQHALWITGGMWTCDGNCPTPFLWKVNDSGHTLDSAMQTYSARSDGIAQDGNNNFYIHGSFQNSQAFGTTTLYGTNSSYYLAKLDGATPLSSFTATQERSSISVFPNPAQNYVTIQINEPGFNGKLNLYDVHGRCCLSCTMPNSPYRLQTSGMPAGLYFVEVDSGAKKIRTKLIVEN